MFGAFIPMIAVGAFTVPYVFTWIRDNSGSDVLSCYASIVMFLLTMVLVALLAYDGRGRDGTLVRDVLAIR